ncbi:Serine/threonine protein kinase [Handroanthus impetiginosus]|uniref:Serine/threonine protein kinase n=1 Tax=Handroanthus impetiginosus TaxID=429701 RepID=A0A2G9I409_9LAMI|nr:Serine/threonine protein kinase [Handroanthus impetiginosus]
MLVLLSHSPPDMSMEGFQPMKILSCLSIWFLFHSCASNSDYTLPDKYFINCGSSASVLVSTQTFIGDESSHGGYKLSSGNSKAVEEPTLAIELYRTARIFIQSSSHEFGISESGIYVVRFHLFPFSSLGNLSNARFNILAYGSPILSNFTVKNSSSDFLPVQEFFLPVSVGKLRIDFVPFDEHSFAFANAIEVFVAPLAFIPDFSDIPVPGEVQAYNGQLRSLLHVIHRINVGGGNITPDNDTLLRYWIPDDDYLLYKGTAKNHGIYTGTLNRQKATIFDAPDSVYRTAKEMNFDNNNDNSGPNTFNMTWRFDVRNRAKHLVRVHFCDIVTNTTNEFTKFNLYIYSKFNKEIYPWDVIQQTAAPFYIDFVVDSDDSGSMSISVAPKSDNNKNQTAFLNGVEIMEVIDNFAPRGSHSKRMNLFIIIGPCVGGVVLVLVILAMFMFCLKRRKWMPVETPDWHLVPLYGGSSHSRTTVRNTTGSAHADLNLGLKVPFSEILYVTRKFDTKLMIGEGGFGKVYKGVLRNGAKVAMKRSEPGHGQGRPEFRREITVLSKIRHQNLVPLIGYCDEGDEMILVYEFMERGTLRDHLYSPKGESEESTVGSKLSWDQRLRICIGAARGLDYLHTGSSRAIIHRDIKSTNILLDEHYVANVADFGLSRLDQVDQTHVTTDVKGSFGYLDPEYLRCFQLTLKSDVYSFGVVLLEVLCARPVIDHSLPRERVNLSEWAMSWQRKGELDKIVDPLLVGKINVNCLRKYGETVEKCLQEYGVDRPSMIDVLWDLEYCLKLQNTAVVREPYEDSTTDVGLPLPVVQRLPSASLEIGESELIHESYGYSDGDVFSQLKLYGAR